MDSSNMHTPSPIVTHEHLLVSSVEDAKRVLNACIHKIPGFPVVTENPSAPLRGHISPGMVFVFKRSRDLRSWTDGHSWNKGRVTNGLREFEELFVSTATRRSRKPLPHNTATSVHNRQKPISLVAMERRLIKRRLRLRILSDPAYPDEKEDWIVVSYTNKDVEATLLPVQSHAALISLNPCCNMAIVNEHGSVLTTTSTEYSPSSPTILSPPWTTAAAGPSTRPTSSVDLEQARGWGAPPSSTATVMLPPVGEPDLRPTLPAFRHLFGDTLPLRWRA